MNKKIIFRIILLISFTTILFVASYAWFQDNSNPSINISNIKVSAAEGLVIKLQPDSPGRTNVSLNSIVTDFDQFELKQVSSLDAKNFYSIDFNEGVALSTPEFYKLPDVNNSNSQMIENGYIDFNFYLQTESYPKHVYIHKDTSITGAAYDALRVAITYPVSTTTNSTIIFGKTAENGITDPYTTKAIITEGAFTYGNIPSNYYTNQLVRTFDNKNGGRATSDTTIIDTNKILFTIPANTRMLVNLKIWLEGGDTECTNSIASTYLDVLFKFGSANELLAAPDVSGVSSNHTITGLTTAMEWSTVNDNSATWTRVTDASQAFTDYTSLYVRIAEDVGVTPESYATLVTF